MSELPEVPSSVDQPDPEAEKDTELDQIVDEESRVLLRVQKHLANRPLRRTGRIDYDNELVSLRDQISEARLEDVPALVAQMERLQQVALRRADVNTGDVDAASPDLPDRLTDTLQLGLPLLRLLASL